jgi:ArsR family transcriptional regulator, arsenate/arsenite/antimonite-responsive transcriptional repressor
MIRSMPARRRLTPDERARVFKALADPRRLELVDSLAKDGPQCGTDLAERLGISLALLSHHWEVLCDAGLIKKERVGQLRFCTLDADRLREATAWDAPKPKAKAKRKPRKSESQ